MNRVLLLPALALLAAGCAARAAPQAPVDHQASGDLYRQADYRSPAAMDRGASLHGVRTAQGHEIGLRQLDPPDVVAPGAPTVVTSAGTVTTPTAAGVPMHSGRLPATDPATLTVTPTGAVVRHPTATATATQVAGTHVDVMGRQVAVPPGTVRVEAPPSSTYPGTVRVETPQVQPTAVREAGTHMRTTAEGPATADLRFGEESAPQAGCPLPLQGAVVELDTYRGGVVMDLRTDQPANVQWIRSMARNLASGEVGAGELAAIDAGWAPGDRARVQTLIERSNVMVLDRHDGVRLVIDPRLPDDLPPAHSFANMMVDRLEENCRVV